MRVKYIILFLAFFINIMVFGENITEDIRIKNIFIENNISGTVVIYDLQSGNFLGFDSNRANKRYIPASTFKIVSSLIGLETGAVGNVDEIFYKYNGVPQFLKNWEKDMGMREAIKVSNVTAYQELAKKIGIEKMKFWVGKLDYGNNQIGDKIDRFWLDGPLEISAVEQTKFLAKLIKNELPLKKENMLNVKEILKLEDDKNMKFYGKTGLATFVNGKSLGWFVGFIEKNGNYYSFALNIDIDDDSELARRIDIVKDSFRVLNIM